MSSSESESDKSINQSSSESKVVEAEPWSAEALIDHLNEVDQDGTLEETSNEWHTVDRDFYKVIQTISTFKTEIECLDLLAFSCPAYYLKYRQSQGASIEKITEEFKSLD